MFAPGVPELLVEFKSNSSELATFCISVYVLGLAAGPMVFAPLSEIYGRVPVYHVTNVGFVGEGSYPYKPVIDPEHTNIWVQCS